MDKSKDPEDQTEAPETPGEKPDAEDKNEPPDAEDKKKY
jgi:hypothetical protein